jgi:HEPN domain-containing protein
MPPDPEETRAWLDRVRTDLHAAEVLADRDDRLLNAAGFQAQPCAVAALKAVLHSRGVRVEKVHNRRCLVDRCAEHDRSLAAFADDLRR